MRDLLVQLLDSEPGLDNRQLRERLVKRGYPAIRKKELNRRLYSYVPEFLRWKEDPEGGRRWYVCIGSPTGSLYEGAPDSLVLSTSGHWAG